MTLGQKLKELRSKNNLTQKELADKLHVSFQTVSKWENGENEPDIATLKELATLFNCSVDYLIGGEEETPKESAPVVKSNNNDNVYTCQVCGERIPEADLYVEDITSTHRVGRRHVSRVTGHAYYHKACHDQKTKEKIEFEQLEHDKKLKRAKKLTLIWSIVGSVVALAIALAIFLTHRENVHPALGVLYSMLIAYGIFSAVYCILSGSYIGHVFLWASGLSIKFPGLIFSWSIDGFAWLIAMKILFAVLGFLIGVFALALAVVLSAALGTISFPFVLIHNINTKYEDSVFAL